MKKIDTKDILPVTMIIKKIGAFFLQGLMAFLPLALTIYILYWLAIKTESMLGAFIKLFIPDRFYVLGMGVFVGFFIILAVGALLRVWLFRKYFLNTERLFERLPVVKFLYGSIRDLMGFFDSTKKKEFNKVVMVSIVDKNIRLIGLVTREDFSNMPAGIDIDNQTIAVYLPMSYQVGGFTVFVPKSNVQPVDMTIEEAMRFSVTAGVSTKKNDVSKIQ